MKYYKYVDYAPDDEECVIVKSEQEIFEEYWPFWYKQLQTVDTEQTKAIRKLPLCVQREHCIDEWIVVNWAWEVKSPEGLAE